ncbi:MAG: hypothetical protein GTN49_08655 [candidate division Zixibacteria bacterium]|nr:hypothetical protein [candidate division Zixibacteria bacterium]
MRASLKANALILPAVAAVLGCALLACGSSKKAEEWTPTPASASAARKVARTPGEKTVTYAGFLRDENDANKFDVAARGDAVEIVFDSPEDAQFHVKVFDAAENELCEFDLTESNVIELLDGREFTLVVCSRFRGGAWTAAVCAE